LNRPCRRLIPVALALLLARAALLGLADPSEARYGQICREMAEGGDWLVPTWQAIPHLEKPPLAYWVGAAGIRLLGRTELAVRLGSLLALVSTALFAAGIARRVASVEAGAPTALAMLAAPLPVAAGVACMTDPFLLFSATLFHHSVVRRLHDGSRGALVFAALALGLGLLAKGHMILLFTVVPLAFAGTGVLRELWRRPALLLLAIALPLAIAAPWFVMIETRFPGFLRRQVEALGGRAMGSGHHSPFYLYALVLAAGLFPFVIYVPRGLAALLRARSPGSGVWRATPPAVRLLLLWLLVPFLVFTVTPSRLWTYILPAVPPLAIFSGARLARLPRAAAWTAGVSTVLVAAIIVGAFFREDSFQIHRSLARDVEKLSEETGGPVVVAGAWIPSIGFYCDSPVTIAGKSGPLAREAEAWGRSPLFTPNTDLKELLASDDRSVIVLPEAVRASLAPQRVAVLRSDDLAVVCPPGHGPVRVR